MSATISRDQQLVGATLETDPRHGSTTADALASSRGALLNMRSKISSAHQLDTAHVINASYIFI